MKRVVFRSRSPVVLGRVKTRLRNEIEVRFLGFFKPVLKP